MRRIIFPVMAMLVLAFLSSCVVREPVHTEKQLINHDPEATLVLLLRDSSIVRLPTFRLQGDSIIGKGYAEKAGADSAFSGAILLDDIEFAQLEHTSGTGTVLIALPTGALAIAVIASMAGSSYVRIEEYTPSSGGSSCPYVYSWDGARYMLEAETFGTSLGRALQRSTRHVLPSLREENGVVRLKIANERPETHVLDRIAVTRVRHAAGTRVVLDAEGRPWQVGVTGMYFGSPVVPLV